jgi:phosphinothricin acetyltransferase
MSVLLRPGSVADAEAINNLYNWYIAHSSITFDIEPWSLSRRQQWIKGFTNPDNPYHLIVAIEDEKLLGFTSNGRFRQKAAYDSSTEVTVYTDPNGVPRGTGTGLYKALFSELENTDLHRAYAVIALPNDISIKLHQNFGFRQVGTLDQVGTKFGERVSVTWFEKTLGTSD